MAAKRKPYLDESALSDAEYSAYSHLFEELVKGDRTKTVSIPEVQDWLKGRYSSDGTIGATTIDEILELFRPQLDPFDSLSVGQFYAILRLINHVQTGKDVSEHLVFIQPSSGDLPPPELKTPPLSSPPDGPLEHTPTKLFDDLKDVDKFLNECRPRMKALLEKAHDVSLLLPSWKLEPSADEKLAKHILDLCIPTLSTGRPSLLLHGLGEGGLDGLDSNRIAHIFAKTHMLLINTSGSGKTRLLLEGLCHHWGFYFVAQKDMSGIGSPDLELVISELKNAKDYERAKAELRKQDSTETELAVEHIREVAERRLAQLLLARFLLLGLLVEEARKITGGLLQKDHRRLWVLLQVQPSIFGRNPNVVGDIFTYLTRLLRLASLESLKQQIGHRAAILSGLLEPEPIFNYANGQNRYPPFFCVLDEVQATVTPTPGCEFMSSDYKTKRPILREIWRAWTSVLASGYMSLVLSGTGIEVQALQDTLSSTAFKEHAYQTMYEIGAFEDESVQTQYIKRYVLPFSDVPRWEVFLSRSWVWFRGRYRTTAALVTLILEGGYRCPHRTIDEYVEEFTGFRPTDGEDWTNSEPQLPLKFVEDRISRLNFDKLSEAQAGTLCNALYEQQLYGSYQLSAFSTEEKDAFVKYGFARHARNDTVIDEPLAVLAALRWANLSTKFSMFSILSNGIHKHSKRQNGFEAYLAFYLQKVFEVTPKLNEVFAFRDDFVQRGHADLAWQHERFKLVTVVNSGNSPQVYPVMQTSGSSSNLGFLAKSGEEVLEWISSNSRRFAFCYPPESFGPDLLFFIQSKISAQLLLVVIQTKKYTKVNREALMQGVRTVTPSWLWKSKKYKHPTADIAPFITNDGAGLAAETMNILAGIQLGLKATDAAYPILRVFASWPGEAGLEWTQKGKGQDDDPHPLASLHLDNFNKISQAFDENWLRGEVISSRKRVREEEDSELPLLKRVCK